MERGRAMKQYSASEVAKMLGKTRRDISHHAKKLKVAKVGTNYVFTNKNIKQIKRRVK